MEAHQIGKEVMEVLTIESQFHKTLIGGGGQGPQNLIDGLVRLCVIPYSKCSVGIDAY